MTPGFNRGSRAAILLIALGILLFLSNLGLIPNIRAYWPLAMSVWGLAMLSGASGMRCRVWPATLVIYGILWTLINLGVLNIRPGELWPIFLIAAGVSMLFGKKSCGTSWRTNFNATQEARSGFTGNKLYDNAVFSGVKRRVESATFEGAELHSSFGEVRIDLRGATISTPNRQAIVETKVNFGAIKLRVPESWKVVVEGSAVFGAYEDKTVPPRPIPGVEPPTLIVRGSVAFGAVEIEN